MKLRIDKVVLFSLFAFLFSGPISLASAKSYPSKPINVIVPYDVGAGVDIFARVLGEFSSEYIGQKFVIINKKGAGGEIGYNAAAKAKPDGYTLAAIVLPNIIYQPKLRGKGIEGYQTDDFIQLATFTVLPNGVFVGIDSPFSNWTDVVNKAKQNPGAVTAGITGAKNTTHGFLLQLMKANDINLKMVTYTGGAPLMKDTIGGHVDLMVANSMFLEYKDTLKCLGIASENKYEFARQVLTFKEQNTPVVDFLTRGVAVPAGTSQDIVDHLSNGFARMAKDKKFTEKMATLSLPISYHDGKETQAMIDQIIDEKSWLFSEFEK